METPPQSLHLLPSELCGQMLAPVRRRTRAHTHRPPDTDAIHQGGLQNRPQERATQPRTEESRSLDQGFPARNYQHDYYEQLPTRLLRTQCLLPAVMTTSGRISGDFLRLLCILSHRQAANYFKHTHEHLYSIFDPSPRAFKQRVSQRRGSYFYYNRAAIGLASRVACARATAMRIDIAPHKHPRTPLSHPSTRTPP